MLLDGLATHETGKPLTLQAILVQHGKLDLARRPGADALVVANEEPARRWHRVGERELGAQPSLRAQNGEMLMRAAGVGPTLGADGEARMPLRELKNGGRQAIDLERRI
jgi:hypothetical protein